MPASSSPWRSTRTTPRRPSKVGEHARQRVPAIDVRVAVGDGDEDGCATRKVRHDMAQKVHAGRVGPVRVVEHEEERALCRRRAEQVHHGVEQQEPLGVHVGRLG